MLCREDGPSPAETGGIRRYVILSSALAAVLALVSVPARGATKPSITISPVSQTNYTFDTVTFTVAASGSDPLIYHWLKNSNYLADFGNISGTTTNKLILSNITLQDAGTYSVIITNTAGGAASTGAVLTAFTRLVPNGGFETGQFPPWIQSGHLGGAAVALQNSLYVNSGLYGAQMGPGGSLGYISQNIPTIVGESYLVSFWLDSPDGQTPNEFVASWGGSILCDSTNIAATGWTNMEFLVTAATTNTALQFGFQNDPSYFGFDDVIVEPVPTIRTISNVGGVAFNWYAVAGFRYQQQFATDLTQPNWSNWGSAVFRTNNTILSETNFVSNRPGQGYYRVMLLP